MAQKDIKNSKRDLLVQLNKTNNDTNTVHVLNKLSNFYLFNKADKDQNADSAAYYAVRATQLSLKINYIPGFENSRMALAMCLIRKNDYAPVKNMLKKASAALGLRLMLLLGESYRDRPGSFKMDLDSAAYFLKKTEQNSNILHEKYWEILAQIDLAVLCNERRNDLERNKWILQARENANRIGNEYLLALILVKKADFLPIEARIPYYNHAVVIFKKLGKTDEELLYAKETADINLNLGKLEISEHQLLDVLQQYKALNYQNLQYTYDLLSSLNRLKGNLDKALLYAMNSVQCMDRSGSDEDVGYFYSSVANVYKDLGQPTQSAKWYKKSVSAFKKVRLFPYPIYKDLIAQLVKQGKIKEAITTTNELKAELSKKHTQGVRDNIMSLYYFGLGNCYNALKEYDKAESYYLAAVSIKNISSKKGAYFAETYHALGQFYVNQHQYEKANTYLTQVLMVPYGIYPASRIAEIHELLFKVDSAKGSYPAALAHYKTFKSIHDSIFSAVKSKQIQELEFKYNLSEKNRDNEALRTQDKLQRIQIQKATLARKLTFLIILALLVVIVLLYYGYQLKQKNNRRLKHHQEEISSQNNHLIKLLDEKEWLVKEIHHRVKNNLQVIMSLLNTQSIYLDNEEAIIAIRDSQNRLQCISLIHQKLYQSNNTSLIDIKSYIIELVQYLSDTFDSKQQLTFDFQIPPISADVTQAVPLGLILNEAITNIFKYAYRDGETGKVNISIDEEGNQFYVLKVRDYGKGLPEDFDLSKTNSLGMDLMRGLSDQLHGSFEIRSQHGVTLEVGFSLLSIK